MLDDKAFRKIKIDETLAKRIEARILAMHRREAITPFIHWVMDLYCRGYLVESDEYRKHVASSNLGETTEAQSRAVHGVGPIRPIQERKSERRRKAS